MCDAATRGIWADAVNAMYLHNQPSIEGTVEQLARLCRCRTLQMQAALCELRQFDVCTVSEQNGCTKLTCRRILRELGTRHLKVKAAKARWSKTDAERDAHPHAPSDSASASASKERECEGENLPVALPPGFPASPDDAVRLAGTNHGGDAFVIDVWNKARGRGGRDAKDVPVRSWEHYVAREWGYEKNRRSEHANNGSTNKGRVNRNEGTLNATATGQYGKLGKVGGV